MTIWILCQNAKLPKCQSTFCSSEPQNILGSPSELYATVYAFYLWNCCSIFPFVTLAVGGGIEPGCLRKNGWHCFFIDQATSVFWVSQIWHKIMQYDYWISIIEYWIEILWLNIEWWPRRSCERHDCLSRNVSKQHNKDSWLCYPGTFMYG